jgi:hypothetical protein
MASRRLEGGGSLRSVHEGGVHEPEGTQDETDSTPFFISCFTGLDLRRLAWARSKFQPRNFMGQPWNWKSSLSFTDSYWRCFKEHCQRCRTLRTLLPNLDRNYYTTSYKMDPEKTSHWSSWPTGLVWLQAGRRCGAASCVEWNGWDVGRAFLIRSSIFRFYNLI